MIMVRIYVYKDTNNDICTDTAALNTQYIYIPQKKHEYHVYEGLQNTMHTKGGNQL